MLNSSFSPYWLILCVLAGLVYAGILYSKSKTPWTKNWNKLLFVLRFATVTFISFLLLEPFISSQVNQSENPKIVMVWDDSQSVSATVSSRALSSYREKLYEIKEKLIAAKTVDVEFINLQGEEISLIDSVQQNYEISPINEVLQQIDKRYDSRKLSEVILISDGIYNRGISPDYFAYPFKITTVGIGDTALKQDIEIQQLRYNKVAYQGNKFPLEAEIIQNGFIDREVKVRLVHQGKLIDSQMLKFTSNISVHKINFLIEATNNGFQSYAVEISALEEEFNKNNNAKSAYINIIEGKKKILLLSPYPHPDIKALRASVERNDNYEFDFAIAANGDAVSNQEIAESDLVILFHLPDVSASYKNVIDQTLAAKKAIWFISGANMNLNFHNEINQSVNLKRWTEIDEAFVYFNGDFKLFELNNEKLEVQSALPPASMPYAMHDFNPRAEVLMMKKVGKVETSQPVFAFYNDQDFRQATLLVEGFRIWRMAEYLNTGKYEFFDEWVSKTIRFLTTTDLNEQFKLFPIKEEFSDNENIIFKVELYNQVYDRIYGIPVSLQLKSDHDSTINYEFIPDRLKPDFEIGNLPAGVYQYQAKTTINSQNYSAAGQFIVTKFAVELQKLQADFSLLKRVAAKNEGKFYVIQQLDSLYQRLESTAYPKILKGDQTKTPLTDHTWLFTFILLLLFSEWFIRRYYGSY